MHIILTGATGTVGAPVMRNCLASPAVTRLSILSRRQFTLPSGEGLDTQKAEIIVHDDFALYPSTLTDRLQGADAVIWAQGISQTQVSKQEYIRITYDYPLAAAKAFSTLSKDRKFNFVYVSGADQTEKTFTLFGKIKGRAELALRKLPSESSYSTLRVFNVRPGFVDPSPLADKREQSALIRFSHAVLTPLLRALAPSNVSPADVLAQVLVDLATGDGEPVPPGTGIEDEGRLVRCVGVRQLGGLR
ncbi:ARM repeat-containing protein [Favolaschia claudopus]|uniref:ARM repeat-containing protein n=1 Tax=Favolaschia claudopus TaxID=2862362 RepID=A0AAW0EE38_9AGAR